jgi:hypothetical protein
MCSVHAGLVKWTPREFAVLMARYIHTLMYVCVYVYIHICIYIYIYAYVLCIYTYICVCTCIHTHTHTYIHQVIDACGVCGGDGSSCGTVVTLTLSDRVGSLSGALIEGRLSDAFINASDPILQALADKLGVNGTQLVLVGGVSVSSRRATVSEVCAIPEYVNVCVYICLCVCVCMV